MAPFLTVTSPGIPRDWFRLTVWKPVFALHHAADALIRIASRDREGVRSAVERQDVGLDADDGGVRDPPGVHVHGELEVTHEDAVTVVTTTPRMTWPWMWAPTAPTPEGTAFTIEAERMLKECEEQAEQFTE